MQAQERERELERFKRDAAYFRGHREELVRRYPDHWVAVLNQEVAGAEPDLEPLLDQLEDRMIKGPQPHHPEANAGTPTRHLSHFALFMEQRTIESSSWNRMRLAGCSYPEPPAGQPGVHGRDASLPSNRLIASLAPRYGRAVGVSLARRALYGWPAFFGLTPG